MASAQLSAQELRPYKEQALQMLAFARSQDAKEIKAVVSVDDQPDVTYLVEREHYEDSDVVEHITVKRGRSSGQVVLFAGPAAWLEA